MLKTFFPCHCALATQIKENKIRNKAQPTNDEEEHVYVSLLVGIKISNFLWCAHGHTIKTNYHEDTNFLLVDGN